MSKQEGQSEAKKAPGAPAGGHAPVASSGGGKGNVGAKVGCHAVGCKEKDVRFNFCNEHFNQFKFGLITKSGERVLDYEKKSEHYAAWVKNQGHSRGKVA